MMDHEQYRSAIMSDPRDQDPALREHREACAECRAFTEQLLRFEATLERALRVDIEARAAVLPFAPKAASPAAPTAPRPWRRLAIAASLALGVAIAGGMWLILPERSLAAAVVAHVTDEPQSWQGTGAVADAELEAVLQGSKLRLRRAAGVVSYASSCTFRGYTVPHLVVQTESGPVTVMVLVHESPLRSMQFDEQGYRGSIVPVAGHGSIAVLMRDAGPGPGKEALRQIVARVSAALDWAG